MKIAGPPPVVPRRQGCAREQVLLYLRRAGPVIAPHAATSQDIISVGRRIWIVQPEVQVRDNAARVTAAGIREWILEITIRNEIAVAIGPIPRDPNYRPRERVIG